MATGAGGHQEGESSLRRQSRHASGYRGRLANPEVLGELVLLMVVGAFFGLMLVESFQWRTSAWLMPRITIAMATPLWLIRVVVLTRHLFGSGTSFRGVRREDETGGQILDLGFYVSEGSLRRFALATGTIGGFVLAVWIIGWHVAVPIYMFLYLFYLGRLPWWGAALGALFMLGIVIGIYDLLFDTFWNDPLVLKLGRTLFGPSD